MKDITISDLVDSFLISLDDVFFFQGFKAHINREKRLEWEVGGEVHRSNHPSDFIIDVMKNNNNDAYININQCSAWDFIVDKNGQSLLLYRQLHCDMMGIDSSMNIVDKNIDSILQMSSIKDDNKNIASNNSKRKSVEEKLHCEKMKKARKKNPAKDKHIIEKKGSKKPLKESYQKQIIRLFYKNSTLSKIDLAQIFNEKSFALLTEEEKRQLSQYLPETDRDKDGIAQAFIFKHQFFKESLQQFQALLAEGWMNPNKNLKQIIEENNKENTKRNMKEERIEEFWITQMEQMDMSWVKEL
jgi:hypothetical protein